MYILFLLFYVRSVNDPLDSYPQIFQKTFGVIHLLTLLVHYLQIQQVNGAVLKGLGKSREIWSEYVDVCVCEHARICTYAIHTRLNNRDWLCDQELLSQLD